MPVIHFIDVTNRDAVQASRIKLAKLQKTMVNIYLGQLGIYQSEFAFPYTRHEYNYIRANLELASMGAMGNIILEGWCRALGLDVASCLPTGVEHLNLSISTSDQMIQYKFKGKLDRTQVIREMVEAVTSARPGGDHLTFTFSPPDKMINYKLKGKLARPRVTGERGGAVPPPRRSGIK